MLVLGFQNSRPPFSFKRFSSIEIAWHSEKVKRVEIVQIVEIVTMSTISTFSTFKPHSMITLNTSSIVVIPWAALINPSSTIVLIPSFKAWA